VEEEDVEEQKNLPWTLRGITKKSFTTSVAKIEDVAKWNGLFQEENKTPQGVKLEGVSQFKLSSYYHAAYLTANNHRLVLVRFGL
jgi:hypothetical protein